MRYRFLRVIRVKQYWTCSSLDRLTSLSLPRSGKRAIEKKVDLVREGYLLITDQLQGSICYMNSIYHMYCIYFISCQFIIVL